MERCPICKHWYFFSKPHICPPRWLACHKNDDGRDAETIFAKTAEDAAADYIERHDDRFGCFTESETVLITRDPDEDDIDWNTLPWQTFAVTGELVRTYVATERPNKQEPPNPEGI